MSRYANWGIIIDDIVFPDGRTAMGVLGGGGLYSAMGMRLWTEEVLFVAAVGDDFDPAFLTRHGLDDSGLFYTDLPTPRAWQLFEENGRRTQIFRNPDDVWKKQLKLPPDERSIPPSMEYAHFLLRGDPDEEKFVLALVANGVRIGAEPIIDSSIAPAEHASMKRCLAHFEFFSPGPEEAEILTGYGSPTEQLPALADMGPQVVALRMGAAGSIVYERRSERFWRVPAAPANVVDVTGAGNAFCGGFFVGWIETGDVLQASAQAAVSAAIIIEQVGPPLIDAALMLAARRRAEQALSAIVPFS